MVVLLRVSVWAAGFSAPLEERMVHRILGDFKRKATVVFIES